MTKWMGIVIGVAAAAAVGCRRAPPPAASVAPPATARAASLDGRVPLPLLPMMAEHQKEQMRDHLGAVREIVAALAKKDFAAVEEASRKIGYSDPMAQMCTHMGAGASGFTPTAIAFHRTADGIGTAARARDAGAVLAALDATLDRCVACHATYKQEIVDEATWTRLTGAPPPMGR